VKKLFAHVLILAVSLLLTGCISVPVIPPLTDAASKGDIESVKALLDDGADVNEWCLGFSPLMAASSGYADVVKLLLDRGADVNLSAKRGDSPLGLAVCSGQADIAKLLIEKGANIDMAIAGLEQKVAQCASQAADPAYTPDQRTSLIKSAATVKSGIRLLERLQRERFPEVQLLQMVPNPSISAQPDPALGGEKRPAGQSDATQRLLDAKKLLDANVITKEEFEAIKAKELPAVLQNPENPEKR
jgi:ankyrin repeat protein